MENAADALKMAAWVLIFVVALSIIINAFGMARQTTDILISYNDNEYYTAFPFLFPLFVLYIFFNLFCAIE